MGSTAGSTCRRRRAPRTRRPPRRSSASRRDYLLRAQLRAADSCQPAAPALARAAAAGITSILATPAGDAIRGQSALINTSLGADEPQIGAVADERRGALVVKTPVALHVTFPERPGGGNAYPNSLMGVIAFVRQAFLDAQHYQRRRSPRHGDRDEQLAARPRTSPLEALQPALAGRCRSRSRRLGARDSARADMAKEFKLEPIVTGGARGRRG